MEVSLKANEPSFEISAKELHKSLKHSVEQQRNNFSGFPNEIAPPAAADETPFARALHETNVVVEIEEEEVEVDEEWTAPPCGDSESPVVQFLKNDAVTSTHDSVEIFVPHRVNSWQRGVARTARRERHVRLHSKIENE
jgi:hypothetical protein